MQVACQAYEFLEGKNLNRTAKECTGKHDEPESYVLVLEYEEEYLFAWVVNVDFELGGGYYSDEREMSRGCGAGKRVVSTLDQLGICTLAEMLRIGYRGNSVS